MITDSPPTGAYFDWAATAPLHEHARRAMQPYLGERFGNASSVHRYGRRVRMAIEEAREQVAAALCVPAADLVWTSGGTEADNLGLLGAARAGREASGRRHLVVSAVEHAAILEPAAWLAREGFEITAIPVDGDGILDLPALRAALRDDTLLVAVMAVNNEIGAMQPLAEVAALARARGALVLSDAVQALGHVAVDATHADLLAVSSHKIGGPQGAGALYVRAGVPLAPLLSGGGQERQRRAGTENVAAIVGFGAAAEVASRDLRACQAAMRTIGEAIVEGVRARLPEARLLGPVAGRAPHVACFAFAGTDAETTLFALDMAGIAASSGSACSSHTLEPSHVLLAMGMDEAAARSTIRFSWGPTTTLEEVARLLDALPDVVARSRRGEAGARRSLQRAREARRGS